MSIETQEKSMIHPDFNYGDAAHYHYLQKGYCIFKNFITDEGLEYCRLHIDRILKTLKPGHPAEEIISPHSLGEKWIWDLATETKILNKLERQIGPNIVLWVTHLLCKPPSTGQAVPWHQDAPYWKVSGPLAGGLWIPFDDIDEENGPMSILPGWHNRGILPRVDAHDGLFIEAIDPVALPSDIEDQKVIYLLKAWQMAIHHTMMPHSSLPNRSDHWRRALVLRYMSAEGEMSEKQYVDYRNGKHFSREYLLVRGQDLKRRGLKSNPFVG